MGSGASMTFTTQLTLVLSLAGVALWALCLVAGLGMGDAKSAFAFGASGGCFILGAFVVFWWSD